MKFDIEKGSTLWSLWGELFLLWKDHGNVHTQADADDWYFAGKELEGKYLNTAEHDLCHNVLMAMFETIDTRLRREREEQGRKKDSEID